jgi:NAD(P)-dependent dehydrogenase (short-subunit alcohol dehydrogenase family)
MAIRLLEYVVPNEASLYNGSSPISSRAGRIQVKLDRRVVIVTGAAAGIGEASARLFAKERAHLVLVDVCEEKLRRVAEDLEAGSAIVLEVVGDVSDAAVCRYAVERATHQFGHIDVLFNNAGIVLNGSLVQCSEDDWQRTMDVNLKSMYLLCREVIPVMLRQGSGSIINMSSIAGTAGVPDRGAYSVSKAGVIGLTKSLAVDYVKEGIRVNCICPATVDTPSLRERIASSPDPEAARRSFLARQPMGRLGTAEEIAAMALFLASDDSRYMTGQAIVMDGGMKL